MLGENNVSASMCTSCSVEWYSSRNGELLHDIRLGNRATYCLSGIRITCPFDKTQTLSKASLFFLVRCPVDCSRTCDLVGKFFALVLFRRMEKYILVHPTLPVDSSTANDC